MLEKTKMNEKEDRNGPFFKKNNAVDIFFFGSRALLVSGGVDNVIGLSKTSVGYYSEGWGQGEIGSRHLLAFLSNQNLPGHGEL